MKVAQTSVLSSLLSFLGTASAAVHHHEARDMSTPCLSSTVLPTRTITLNGAPTYVNSPPGGNGMSNGYNNGTINNYYVYIYEVVYEEFCGCANGLANKTYTVTKTCDTAPCTCTDTKAIPTDFTTVVLSCIDCGPKPITATLTCPTAYASAYATASAYASAYAAAGSSCEAAAAAKATASAAATAGASAGKGGAAAGAGAGAGAGAAAGAGAGASAATGAGAGAATGAGAGAATGAGAGADAGAGAGAAACAGGGACAGAGATATAWAGSNSSYTKITGGVHPMSTDVVVVSAAMKSLASMGLSALLFLAGVLML